MLNDYCRRPHLFTVITVLAGCQPVVAAGQWVRLKTPHFEMYTTAGEKKGREAILYFEQVRSFFLEGSPSKRSTNFPVRIVAFRSEKQYRPYRINAAALAYYTKSQSHDYIVMQDISSEHYPVAIHEYTHMIIEHTGLKLPIWLNEGWAELYSSLKPMGNKAAVGALIPGRVQSLLTQKWLNLDVLSTVDQKSPFYNEKDRAGIFYAQSWLLVHMMYISANYRPNFTKFVLTVSSGKSMEESCQAAFGKGLGEVQADLQRYIKSDRFYGAVFDVKLEKSAEEPEVVEPSNFESDLVTADLLALVGKKDEAREAYEQLAKNNPGKPEVEESLGYLLWQFKDQDGARRHFASAMAAGSTNAQMCFHYAALEQQAGTNRKDVIRALQRAVDLKPDYEEARLRLGLELVSEREYKDAIGHLRQIKTVGPDQAPWFFSALAYSYMQTGDQDKARQNAASAKKWAKTPEQIEQADSMLRYLDTPRTPVSIPAAIAPASAPTSEGASEPSKPVLTRTVPRESFDLKEESRVNPFVKKDDLLTRIEGTAQRLDCNGTSARFHVKVGAANMVFAIPDPTNVLIRHSGEVHHDFACGAQKPFHVIVEYAAQPDSKNGTDGIVRSLEF